MKINNLILIFAIFGTTINVFGQPYNVGYSLIWDNSSSSYKIYLSNGSAPETISFSAFNLDIDAPDGTTFAFGSNPYTILLDNSPSAGGVYTYAKTSSSVGVIFTAAPLFILELIPSGPNSQSQINSNNFYVELAGFNRTFSGPLPITLSTFSAIQHSDRASKLDWTTSTEINSDYFGIERSRDGDTWETISQLAAAGNSSEEKYYEYIDDKLPFSRSKDQIFYYRLRLTDQDGSFKYSDIKGVNFNRQTADGVIAVYPNPATQMVHIDVVGMDESQGETKLRIFDMYGRVMLDKAILGSGLEPVDVLQYPSGVYNISVTQGDKLHQKQFIKVE